MNGRYSTLNEFWPFYVSQHLNPVNRRLHFAGTTVGLVLLALAAAARVPALLAVALAVGYAPAWVGHFFFEKNRPATFRYPLLSLRADFRMYARMWRGEMDADIVRLKPELSRLRAE
ncbi:MAG: DUF962 domain-containing protein [Elusimicrobia bacterium]|nr:DUF962 domain-containing protein [Elusimicrobiota bacterium]